MGFDRRGNMSRRTYYDLIRQRLAGAVAEAAVAAREIQNSALAGRIREIALRDCIAPYLTHSFRCASGKIIDTTGYVTNQIDLIVYETKLAPPLLIGEEFGIFPAECCPYVFEVKSTLTSTEIKRSINTGSSVRRLRRFPTENQNGEITYKDTPPAVLFAFSTDINGNELERYLEYDKNSCPMFTVLFVVGKGYWFWNNQQWYGVRADEHDSPEGIFASFIAGFTNTLAGHEATLRGFSPGKYMCPEELVLKPLKSAT
jgi:hypothetical protein